MSCTKYYYAYIGVPKQNHAQLLAAYDNGNWKEWFSPYGTRLFPIDQSMLQVVTDVDDAARQALVASGCSSASTIGDVATHLRRITIPPASMNDWEITCLPPDPKLPPATADMWRPYSRAEFKQMVLDSRAAARAGTPHVVRFQSAIVAAEECASTGRFAAVVSYIRARTFDKVAMRVLASCLELDRADGGGELNIIQAIAGAVPPSMPRPEHKIATRVASPDDPDYPVYEKMSDHREWQFRMLAALLDVLYCDNCLETT